MKEIYILVLFSFHATGSFLFFTFVVQLWITTVSYKLWRLLAPVAPERARALANGAWLATTRVWDPALSALLDNATARSQILRGGIAPMIELTCAARPRP